MTSACLWSDLEPAYSQVSTAALADSHTEARVIGAIGSASERLAAMRGLLVDTDERAAVMQERAVEAENEARVYRDSVEALKEEIGRVRVELVQACARVDKGEVEKREAENKLASKDHELVRAVQVRFHYHDIQESVCR